MAELRILDEYKLYEHKLECVCGRVAYRMLYGRHGEEIEAVCVHHAAPALVRQNSIEDRAAAEGPPRGDA